MAEKSFWGEKKDKEWVSNFFFYYSKHVIVGIILLIIIVYSCVSCATKIEYDLEMYYLSDKYFEADVFDNVENALSKVVDDINEKHGTVVLLNDYTTNTDDKTAAEMNMAMTMKIQVEVAEGSGYLYIVNDNWLDFCLKSEILQDISNYTGEDSPSYYVEITDNKFLNNLGLKDNGKLYACLRMLNENRKDKEIEVMKHKNAEKAIQYIIENK